MASTITGMALDYQQHRTWTTLTTSLGKTGSRKHSLLDVSPNDQNPYDINSCNIHEKPPLTKNDFLAVFPNAFPNNAPNNILPLFYSTEYILHTLPPSLPIPATFPREGSVVQKSAKLKTSLNQQQACLKRIPHQFFQAYATPTLPNAEALYALYCLDFVAYYQDSIERNWCHNPPDTKQPSKTQYAYLNEKPLLYTTQWNITSD